MRDNSMTRRRRALAVGCGALRRQQGAPTVAKQRSWCGRRRRRRRWRCIAEARARGIMSAPTAANGDDDS